MKKEINKFYIGPVRRITNIKYENDRYMDTITKYYFKDVYPSIFYKYDDNKFIDIIKKIKYSSDIDSHKIGDLVIDKRKLMSIIEFCNLNNIDLPVTNKISEKRLIKTLIDKKE